MQCAAMACHHGLQPIISSLLMRGCSRCCTGRSAHSIIVMWSVSGILCVCSPHLRISEMCLASNQHKIAIDGNWAASVLLSRLHSSDCRNGAGLTSTGWDMNYPPPAQC